MISVRVVLRRGGLRFLRSEGHAVDSGEGSVPCAAVSALVGAASRALINAEGCQVDGSAPDPGYLELQVLRVRPGKGRWLRGVTDVLLKGLKDVGREFPGAVHLVIEEKGE